MKTLTLAVYTLAGAGALLAGIVALFVPDLALPPDARTALTIHLIREEAAAFVFIGMMLLWCVRHFEAAGRSTSGWWCSPACSPSFTGWGTSKTGA